MLKARVIKPNSRAKGVLPSKGLPPDAIVFKCGACKNANYSRKDYKILYIADKLCNFKTAFSKAEDIILCHDCFSKHLAFMLNAQGLGVIDVEITEGKEKHIMSISYENEGPSDFNPF